uniref:Uncharacterized protein n=1 Tax=Tanacetum cinerariifolium TaxID=118510 RepID=A0A699I771_TANCI|nr:hypothetical protein [Tanacetum cinerariifolium]
MDSKIQATSDVAHLFQGRRYHQTATSSICLHLSDSDHGSSLEASMIVPETPSLDQPCDGNYVIKKEHGNFIEGGARKRHPRINNKKVLGNYVGQKGGGIVFAAGDVLAVGDGKLPAKIKDEEDEPSRIEIHEKFLIKSANSLIEQIVAETYPNFIERQMDDAYLRERAILTPRNDDANAINAYTFNKFNVESINYNSADEICKVSTDTLD